MKIKIVYGVDMRLWRHGDKILYKALLDYVRQTFEFMADNHFRITFKDDDDTQTTIASQDDLTDAINFAQMAKKKSLKLYIADCNQKQPPKQNESEQKETVPPIQSNISSYAHKQNQNAKNDETPSSEQLNSFLSDDVVIALLTDLFIAVFEALQSSNFEVSFIECVQAIILSSDGKYDKITTNPIWPYFVNQILAKKAQFMMPFAMNMMKMNADAIKQWVPTILNMLKHRAQNGNINAHGFGPWRGRGRGRGRRGRGRRGRGRWGGFHENFHNFGDNPWCQTQADNGKNDEEDEIEQEVFEYTEELVAILNMGFSQMQKIKKLLNGYKE